MSAVRTLVVWCPDWPVVAAGANHEPAAVLHANRIVACSAAARSSGVQIGLRRREAQARCPSLRVLERDESRDARAFEPVVAAVETMCPRVEVVQPGVCAFPTRGPSRYFGGDGSLAARAAEVAGRAVPFAIAVQAGVADGRFAATLAAHRGLVVEAGGSSRFLAPYPVEALGMPELQEILVRLGVRTLSDLAALPLNKVAGRFGDEGRIAHRLARGLDELPPRLRIPPPDLVASMPLDPPVHRVDQAAFAAKTLADELHGRLGALALACTRIAIEVRTEHGESLVRLWRHDGALTAQAIADRVRWQLDGWLQRPGSDGPTGAIEMIRLVPDEVKPATGRQPGFWGGDAEAADRASRALARVQGMLGHEAVVTAVLTGGRSPADRVRYVPWGDPRDDVAPVEPWPGHIPSPSPATVFGEPQAVEVLDAAGRPVVVTGRGLVHAPPARLDGEPVVAWSGPWPSDERWWDASARRRRARFQIVTPSRAVLASVESGRWQVEAVYD